jgi:hypothetical protein
MQIFKSKSEAIEYAVKTFGADYVEFFISVPFKITETISNNFCIDKSFVGNYALSNEFDEIYA